MANTKSAEKRMRQSAERRERNRSNRSTMRTAIKGVRSAVAAGDVKAAETALKGAIQVIDKSAKRRARARLCCVQAPAIPIGGSRRRLEPLEQVDHHGAGEVDRRLLDGD